MHCTGGSLCPWLERRDPKLEPGVPVVTALVLFYLSCGQDSLTGRGEGHWFSQDASTFDRRPEVVTESYFPNVFHLWSGT